MKMMGFWGADAQTKNNRKTIQKRREISFLQIIGLYTSWKLYMYWNSSTVYNLHCTAAITKIQYAPAVVPASSLVLHTTYYCFLNKPCESCWARALYSKNPRTHCRTSHAHTHALQQTPMMCIVHTNTCLVWMELIMWLFGFFMYILNGLYCINKGTVKRLTFTEVFFELYFLTFYA